MLVIDGSDDWQSENMLHYFTMHHGCLSILCRRTNTTPKGLWESMYAPGTDYNRDSEDGIGLMYCIKYYDMRGRNGQWFNYAIEKQTPSKNVTGGMN